MIDPTQLPILLKAIDFVFEEGRKILEERRERRKAGNVSPEKEEKEPAKEIALPEPEKEVKIKQDLLSSKIDDLLWESNKSDIEGLVRILETQKQSYYLLKEQYEKFGSAFVPTHIALEIERKEKAMLETMEQLEVILSKVYKKDINPIK